MSIYVVLEQIFLVIMSHYFLIVIFKGISGVYNRVVTMTPEERVRKIDEVTLQRGTAVKAVADSKAAVEFVPPILQHTSRRIHFCLLLFFGFYYFKTTLSKVLEI